MSGKYDLQILPGDTADVTFSVAGSSADTGLMLLQRLYILLFTSYGTEYRHGRNNAGLLSLLDGTNTPPDKVLASILSVCRAQALAALDKEDRDNIASFTCACSGGRVNGTLVLRDGTTIHGVLNNV